MPRLIINADDFGLALGVNRAILQAHSEGIVTSTTLMANALAFDEAAQSASVSPTLDIGCHLVFIDGSPVLSPSEVPSLLRDSSDAHFHTSLGRFAGRAVFGHISLGELQAEATAQIRKLQLAGIKVSHVDTHKHVHILPIVSRAVMNAAKTCGIRALRNPFSPVTPLPLNRLLHHLNLWKRHLAVCSLRCLAGRFRRAARDAGLITPDGSFGIVITGHLDLSLFSTIVERLPEGTWEFVCHPGYNDSTLAGVSTRLRESRAKELELLMSKAAREALQSRGIELISYRDLVSQESA